MAGINVRSLSAAGFFDMRSTLRFMSTLADMPEGMRTAPRTQGAHINNISRTPHVRASVPVLINSRFVDDRFAAVVAALVPLFLLGKC